MTRRPLRLPPACPRRSSSSRYWLAGWRWANIWSREHRWQASTRRPRSSRSPQRCTERRLNNPVQENAAPSGGGFVRLLRRVIDVRPEELPVLVWCWIYIFSIFLSYYIMRPIRDEMGVAGGGSKLRWGGT